MSGWLLRLLLFFFFHCIAILSSQLFSIIHSLFFFSFPTADLFWQSTGRTVGPVCELCRTNLWDRHWKGGSMSPLCSSLIVGCNSLWGNNSQRQTSSKPGFQNRTPKEWWLVILHNGWDQQWSLGELTYGRRATCLKDLWKGNGRTGFWFPSPNSVETLSRRGGGQNEYILLQWHF